MINQLLESISHAAMSGWIAGTLLWLAAQLPLGCLVGRIFRSGRGPTDQ